MSDVSGEFLVQKSSYENQLVFGWANISMGVDGSEIVDHHGDVIGPDDLELAAYEFVLHERASGEDHSGDSPSGMLVESMFFDAAKIRTLATDPFSGEYNEDVAITLSKTIPTGWWVGFHIPDRVAFERAIDNKTMFSIEGSAVREKAA